MSESTFGSPALEMLARTMASNAMGVMRCEDGGEVFSLTFFYPCHPHFIYVAWWLEALAEERAWPTGVGNCGAIPTRTLTVPKDEWKIAEFAVRLADVPADEVLLEADWSAPGVSGAEGSLSASEREKELTFWAELRTSLERAERVDWYNRPEAIERRGTVIRTDRGTGQNWTSESEEGPWQRMIFGCPGDVQPPLVPRITREEWRKWLEGAGV